jgi:hypothetical protein
MGLKPIIRRVWSPKAQRPIAVQHRAYQWLHAYAFVQPESGRSEFWIASHVDTVTMNIVLEQFVATVNPKQDKIILLLWDNAGWHKAIDLKVPPAVVLFPIPAYTPELSPAEPIVPLLHEAIANKTLTSLKQLQDNLQRRCKSLHHNLALVKGACGFGWTFLNKSSG